MLHVQRSNYQKPFVTNLKCSPTLTLPPPGLWVAFSRDPIFGLALSLKSSFTLSIFFSPPPGLCVALSKDPTFGLAFHCSFTCWIWGINLIKFLNSVVCSKICLFNPKQLKSKWHWKFKMIRMKKNWFCKVERKFGKKHCTNKSTYFCHWLRLLLLHQE